MYDIHFIKHRGIFITRVCYKLNLLRKNVPETRDFNWASKPGSHEYTQRMCLTPRWNQNIRAVRSEHIKTFRMFLVRSERSSLKPISYTS